jgi:hypothetical protein
MKNLDCKCHSCWNCEGGRCYVEPCEREADGRSKKMAIEMCDKYESKRSVLLKVIPTDRLTIMSETNKKATI